MPKIRILRKNITEAGYSLTVQFDYGMTIGISFPKTTTKEEALMEIARRYLENMPPDWLANMAEGLEVDISDYIKKLSLK